MRTRSLLLTTILCLFIGVSFVSCDDDDDKIEIPTEMVTGLSFTDTDLTEGIIKGTLSWSTLNSNSTVTKFIIYQSADGKSKENKLGETDATTNRFEIPEGTSYKEYIMVVTANGLGEATTGAFLKIEDAINEPIPPTPVSGYYFLNSGKFGNNNASLYFYKEDGTLEADVFKTKNGRGLGDSAQDMIVYGNKMYIAMYNSGTIEVTDLEGKSIKQIKAEDSPLQPRALIADGGYVYASLYNGYVARLDTIDFNINKTAVGRNPEQMVIAKNQLYVANSGGLDHNTEVGYDKTVSVVNLESFTETRKIEVGTNPCSMQVDSKENVYVISMGNYEDIPNMLQVIDPDTDEVTVIGNATEMTMLNDKIYMYYSQYDANWNQTITFYVYDTDKAETTEGFISDGSNVAKPYKICSDPKNNSIMVMESDYTSNGDVYIFNEAGALRNKVEVGLNPMKGVAVTYYK